MESFHWQPLGGLSMVINRQIVLHPRLPSLFRVLPSPPALHLSPSSSSFSTRIAAILSKEDGQNTSKSANNGAAISSSPSLRPSSTTPSASASASGSASLSLPSVSPSSPPSLASSPSPSASTPSPSPSPSPSSPSPSPSASPSASASASASPSPSSLSPSPSPLSSSSTLVDTPSILRGMLDYMDRVPSLISSSGPTSQPRWFCPLESGTPPEGSPLLLFLPGMDGTGLGIIGHYESLGRMFEVRCLHIPVADRTPFEALIKIVEDVVLSESYKAPSKPIYMVGDSFGGALALAVASRNPKVDLVLVLANPATSFANSQLQPLLPLMDFLPDQIYQAVPYLLSFTMGDPIRMALATVEKKLPDVDKALAIRDNLVGLLPTLSVLADILPKEALLWKINLLTSAALYANSRLHAVQAEVLLLVSGKDQMLPSRDEAKRLKKTLKKCVVRYYKDSGHTLLLEDSLDLGTVIRGAKLYRRSSKFDAVSDFIAPTRKEFDEAYERNRLFRRMTSPVFLSKMEGGKIVQGLSGIPNDRPILLVGYHMLMGLELSLLVSELLKENRVVRGAAHPILFSPGLEGDLPEPSFNDDVIIFGALPARNKSFIKALASGHSILLYPGGAREALHRKGEAYKLFWPNHPEFVRAAARYGVTIVPFGAVGEDDVIELLMDYDDIQRVPFLSGMFEEANVDALRIRRGQTNEAANQDLYIPLLAPKLPPGRMYFLFGKPFRTAGKEDLLRNNREAAEEVYYDVKKEVEECLEYLLKKREEDPYRDFLPRFLYESTAGGDSQAPTFKL